MSTTPPMYDHVPRGTVRHRALAWFADHSYLNSAARGAAFALGTIVVQYLVRQLDDLMPGPRAEQAISMRWFLLDGVVMVLLAALLMCLATASARGLVRLSVRSHTGAG